MKTPVTQHEPLEVVPDLTPAESKPGIAISAINMQMNNTPPVGGAARRRVPGNKKIPNSLLPESGVVFTISATKIRTTGQQIFLVYNSDGDHSIYLFTEPDVFQLLLRTSILGFKQGIDPDGPDYVADYCPDVIYISGGFLLWCDGINEDRYINIERAIDGFYDQFDDTYLDWILSQAQRSPAFPPVVLPNLADSESDPLFIQSDYIKPIASITKTGMQFGYNTGNVDNIECRISQPSIVNWNNKPYLLVPEYEFDNFITIDGTNPNPFILYVKFYYRLGNTGDWILFKKIDNEAGNYITPTGGSLSFGFLLPDLFDIGVIGGVSASALNLIEGMPQNSKTLNFGGNVLVKGAIKTGYNIQMPSITIEKEFGSTLANANWRGFLPIPSQKHQFFQLFWDKRGRLIATKDIGVFGLAEFEDYTWSIAARLVDGGNGGTPVSPYPLIDHPWQWVVDWAFNNSSIGYDFPPSTIDKGYSPSAGVWINGQPYFKFTPDGDELDENIETITIGTRNHSTVSWAIRTQIRAFYIYQGPSQEFVVFLDNTQGNIVDKDGVNYTFYGIGFEFASGEPISFSEEQNYHVRVVGELYPILRTSGIPFDWWCSRLNKEIEFKITAQIGNILVSKQPFIAADSNTSGVITGDTPYLGGYFSIVGTDQERSAWGPYEHYMGDVILYSKVEPYTQDLRAIPDLTWSRDEWESAEIKKWHGDAYITNDKKSMVAESRQVYGRDVNGLYSQIEAVEWQGTWAAMNLNGIYLENWSSDIGNAFGLNPVPKQLNLEKTMIHGAPYMLGTEVNNIFSFAPDNTATISGDIGAIVALRILATGSSTGENIYCICKAGSEVRLLGKIQQIGTNGFGPVVLSTNVFGSENTQPLLNGASTIRDIIASGEGQIFYFDRLKKVFMQITLGGQDPISIQQFSVSDMLQMGDLGCIGYDPLNMEVVYAARETGFAYNFLKKTYQGFRKMGVENFTEFFSFGSSALYPKMFYGWCKGELYKFNDYTSEEQTFNEEPFEASISIISNPAVQALKNFSSVRYHSLAGKVWKARVTNPAGRTMEITQDEFEEYAGYFKGSIMTDENSEGGRYNGDVINGPWLIVKLTDIGNSPKDLTFVEIGYTPSLQQ